MAIRHVAPADLARWFADHAGTLPPVLLDVREPAECAVASISVAGAALLQWPMAAIPERLPELETTRPIAVLCHSGQRSLMVAEFLTRNGFAEVVNVEGGIDAWSVHVDPKVPRY